MQRRRDSKGDSFEPGNMFPDLGIFGSHRTMLSDMFDRRDPFDDSFFTHPFSGNHSSGSQFTNVSKGIVIEEIISDDEGGLNEEKSNDAGDVSDVPLNFIVSCVEPSVEHPDDDANEVRSVQFENDANFMENLSRPHGFSYKKVTYGGVDGAYYTASNSRRAGSDGVVLEEKAEADKITGRAAHRISRGINEKGHSITSKFGPDGKVDTTQTLHNLEKEELSGFEEAWKGDAGKNILPGWNRSSNMFRDTESEHLPRESEAFARLCPGKAKKVVRINID